MQSLESDWIERRNDTCEIGLTASRSSRTTSTSRSDGAASSRIRAERIAAVVSAPGSTKIQEEGPTQRKCTGKDDDADGQGDGRVGVVALGRVELPNDQIGRASCRERVS